MPIKPKEHFAELNAKQLFFALDREEKRLARLKSEAKDARERVNEVRRLLKAKLKELG